MPICHMASIRYDQQALQGYREKLAQAAQLREQVEELAQASKVSGDLAPAQSLLNELSAKTKELGDIRGKLGKVELFLTKYGYERINDHTVSFVVPKGYSRLEILNEAQALVSELDSMTVIHPDHLAVWAPLLPFRRRSESAERICIDGHVEGGDGMDRDAHEKFIADKGFKLPSTEDLAVAFALHWVATHDSLFGWAAKDSAFTFRVRSAEDTLDLHRHGLGVAPVYDTYKMRDVAVSARIPLGSIVKE